MIQADEHSNFCCVSQIGEVPRKLLNQCGSRRADLLDGLVFGKVWKWKMCENVANVVGSKGNSSVFLCLLEVCHEVLARAIFFDRGFRCKMSSIRFV